uniref:Succinate--CoA ligase [ADP-forming] subunit beta, mitochondrial n=1 Tax=Chromera velia CCMP2878 TaxID=1169474 RepID=A0A0G4F164_9ALVE|eukprot:Cvel_14620.t1-p1 / transcript=Cvel_14620.t1 / gene=Cvel_14620 / organism=Chromera_velia_CCMP2878 / gene_product=Succinyl-CoA ligase [GDP-forming] subunit beta,, putative / transcript_product=Succinyl-CoA ligase [GDP-forming] subunit beta,, putative / location=Cvel_scaffold1046:3243-10057(+) / protein_length=417 / sequence_SO=supercontig / SO=protein_coding / is_pseudo=false
MFAVRRQAAPAFFALQARRFLNLHEYQSKALLGKFGLNVQKGAVAANATEARQVAERLKTEGAKDLILKSQILAGGRGKGTLSSGLKGGVKICATPDEVEGFAKQMVGYKLITHQTGPEGQNVNKVLVHEGVDIVKELYLAIVLDRKYGGPVLIASKEGGMDIEEVAEKNPDAIHLFPVDIVNGMDKSTGLKVADALGFTSEAQKNEVAAQVEKLYKLFCDTDAVQVEINPFALTDTGDVYCVDAKINFDDNAAFRQRELFDQEDEDTKDPREAAAEKHALNYIGLDGNIGCLVNGAGLAMATMDIIQLHGGTPANFLDVGGSANKDQVAEAFRILQGDPQVKAILVNIFGGIMKCDTIASGILAAAQAVELKLPLVVRLNGTNVDLGRKILAESDVKCQVIDDLDEAAKAAVATLS